MDGIPPALQPPRAQLRLAPHPQQQRPHRLPSRRRQPPLDPTDRGLRRTRPPRQRALAQTTLPAQHPDQITQIVDTEKYIA
jgi:hypothetical protein